MPVVCGREESQFALVVACSFAADSEASFVAKCQHSLAARWIGFNRHDICPQLQENFSQLAAVGSNVEHERAGRDKLTIEVPPRSVQPKILSVEDTVINASKGIVGWGF